MVLIGIYISERTPVMYRKTLKGGWYPFVDSAYDDENEIVSIRNEVPVSFFKVIDDMPEVNFSAIVGMNGTGKSSLLDLVLMTINNFVYEVFKINWSKQDVLVTVPQIDTKLFYSIGKELFCIKSINGEWALFRFDGKEEGWRTVLSEDIVLEKKDGNEYDATRQEDEEGDRLVRNCLKENFFYSIAVNFGLYAYNPYEWNKLIHNEDWTGKLKLNDNKELKKDDDIWFNPYFHRVDGYSIPLTLVPSRHKGVIDVNEELRLAHQRVCALDLFLYSKKQRTLVPGYRPECIRYVARSFDEEKTKNLVMKLYGGPNDQNILYLVKYKSVKERWTTFINRFGIDIPKNLLESTINYLTYKTFKICCNFPAFDDKVLEGIDADDPNIDKDTVGALARDSSHVTVKIRAALEALKNRDYWSEEGQIDVSNLINGNHDFKKIQSLLPPPFYHYELTYKSEESSEGDCLTIECFSSGERQVLFTLSAVLEHLVNLSSIVPTDHTRLRYKYINVILDEIELYFHPEYQRMFINTILDFLSSGIVSKKKIHSVNFLLVTHSPYLLSDIPSSNVLFLGKGNKERKKTLAANIYDLLRDGFFMKNSIGEFASKRMQKAISIVRHGSDEEYNRNKDWINFLVEEVGDTYLQKILRMEVGKRENIDYKIRILEKELDHLKRLRNEKN